MGEDIRYSVKVHGHQERIMQMNYLIKIKKNKKNHVLWFHRRASEDKQSTLSGKWLLFELLIEIDIKIYISYI